MLLLCYYVILIIPGQDILMNIFFVVDVFSLSLSHVIGQKGKHY